MLVAAGDARIDNAKYKARFHQKAKMMTAEELERFLTVRLGRSRENLPQQITHGQFFLLADTLMGADR